MTLELPLRPVSTEILGFVGLDFRTADLALRSRAALTGVRIPGCVVLSTCNRTEIYFVGDPPSAVWDWADRFDGLLVRREGIEVARHLFRVVAGLESAVLGEVEIVTQVRAAYAKARPSGALDLLFRRAMEAGKRVRTETELTRNVVSVASLAVREATRYGSLATAEVLVLGAGGTAERVVKGLRSEGARHVRVLNRTPERARALAEPWGYRWGELSEVEEALHRADVVFGTASTPRPLVNLLTLDRILANRCEPLTLIDLGLPPNVETGEGLPGLRSVGLDSLTHRCSRNAERRAAAAPGAIRIVDEEVARYEAEWSRRARRR